MATIQTRERADGSIAYRVLFRIPPSRSVVSETFDTAVQARHFAALVDRIGGKAARAKRDLAAATAGPALAEVLEDYVARAPDITAGTAAEYRRMLDRSGILEQLGALPVELIAREDVERWVQVRSSAPSPRTGRPIAAKTVRNEHGLLSTLLGHAQARGWVPSNPAQRVRLPRVEPRELVILEPAAFLALVDAMTARYRPLVMLLGATGLRWGEATALAWRDVDARVPSVRVRRAWKHDAAHGRVLGPPKTRRAYRTIETGPSVIGALGARGRPDDLVFTNARGGPIVHQTFHESHWVPACDRAALTDPRPRVHDLRHFTASHMLIGGADLIEVSRALGHESIKTTADVYGHLVPSRTRPTVAHARMLSDLLAAGAIEG